MIKRKIRKIDILGVKHKISYPKLEDGAGAYYYPVEKKIEIDGDITDETEYIEDLLHESFHGVLYVTGIHQDITLAQEHCIIDSMITFLLTNFNLELKK